MPHSPHSIELGLNDVICLTDSVAFTPSHCSNLKAIRYE